MTTLWQKMIGTEPMPILCFVCLFFVVVFHLFVKLFGLFLGCSSWGGDKIIVWKLITVGAEKMKNRLLDWRLFLICLRSFSPASFLALR